NVLIFFISASNINIEIEGDMDNISSIVLFTLTGLDESWTNRLIIFVFTLLGFILTVVLNLTLIVIIILQRSLHEPMYIFLCNLCINGLYGSTGLYPVFLYPLTGSNMISLSDCVLQIFVIMTYSLCEFTNLTVMALDRYMAICRPLHYQTVMTRVTIYKLLIFIWLLPCATTGLSISIMLRYPLCGSHIDRLFCQNWALIERLACQEDIVKHIVNGSFFVWFNSLVAFLIFSYLCTGANALPDQKAETTVNAITVGMYSRFGAAESIHSDQGRNFESFVFAIICERLGVHKTRPTPLPPQSDGLMEHFNKTLAIISAKYQRDWDKHLPMKINYVVHTWGRHFVAEDMVWVYSPLRKKGCCPKFDRHWVGSCSILERMGEVVYQVQLPPRGRKVPCGPILFPLSLPSSPVHKRDSPMPQTALPLPRVDTLSPSRLCRQRFRRV
ncbi:olfactory receptor 6C1-like, partial [Salvelinus alpinus]